jgi:hypothetical protein
MLPILLCHAPAFPRFCKRYFDEPRFICPAKMAVKSRTSFALNELSGVSWGGLRAYKAFRPGSVNTANVNVRLQCEDAVVDQQPSSLTRLRSLIVMPMGSEPIFVLSVRGPRLGAVMCRDANSDAFREIWERAAFE